LEDLVHIFYITFFLKKYIFSKKKLYKKYALNPPSKLNTTGNNFKKGFKNSASNKNTF